VQSFPEPPAPEDPLDGFAGGPAYMKSGAAEATAV